MQFTKISHVLHVSAWILVMYLVCRFEGLFTYCFNDLQFEWIDCSQCEYLVQKWDLGSTMTYTLDIDAGSSDICDYCAMYRENEWMCLTLDFTLSWIVFAILYFVNVILVIIFGFVGCKQIMSILYRKDIERITEM